MEMKKEPPFISDITEKLNVERNIECGYCDKMFKYKSEMKVHVKKIHLKIKDYFCDNCDKSFASQTNLNTHLPTHLENNFPCYICGLKLSRKINLINHMKSLHIENVKETKFEQPTPEKLPCHICGKLFNSNKNLRKHARNHDVIKLEKAQRFSNSFKLEVLEKVKEVGVVTARKVFGIHENTIKG